MREARWHEVWQYLRLRDVLGNWDNIQRHLGRKREFSVWLIDGWRKDGLLNDATTDAPVGAVILDTRREIAANKVAALVWRSELRDLVDLKLLLESGGPRRKQDTASVLEAVRLSLTGIARPTRAQRPSPSSTHEHRFPHRHLDAQPPSRPREARRHRRDVAHLRHRDA